MNRKRIVFGIGVLLVTIVSWAQAPVYTCDFEDETERKAWILNKAINPTTEAALANKWYIGAAGHHAPKGNYGLFVSSDGTTPKYSGAKTMFVTAVRDMPTLPEGDYTLYFDWQCNGKEGTRSEGFYVAWVPVDVKINGSPNAGSIPQWVRDYVCPKALKDTTFRREDFWTVGKVHIQHDGKPHKLVFLWFNTLGEEVAPSACIDNIELRPTNHCDAPTDVECRIKSDTVVLSWKGNAAYYDIKYYDKAQGTWNVCEHVTGDSCELPHVPIGMQLFTIRAFCNDTTASDFVQYPQFVYHNTDMCIDYLALTNRNCFIGTYDSDETMGGPIENCKIDSGFANPGSRHTIHYLKDELDAMSDYKLRTVPDGYQASVRLGDANHPGNKSEAIEYKYTVRDGTTAVLKIKYAMVQEEPGHLPKDQPHFYLEVLDGMNRIPCGLAKFSAGNGDGWERGFEKGKIKWVYQQWREHAINLRDYVGRTLTIRLVTTDCQPQGHTGYVYFVLDCENGEMEGLNCGEDNPTTHFTAPAGFNYEWYKAGDPKNILSREQEFDIEPLDTAVYCVNIINKASSACRYTLSVSGLPRVPMPKFDYSIQPSQCQNVVVFDNQSAVFRKIRDTYEPTDEPLSSLIWDFDDGTIEDNTKARVEHVYPPEGGTYILRVTAASSGDGCEVSKEDTLKIPSLFSPVTELDEHVCRGDASTGYTYGPDNTVFRANLDSTFTYTSSRTGCDSLCHLVLTFHDPGPYVRTDSICYGDSVVFFGRVLRETGRYDTTLLNAWQCDSIMQLDLYVDPQLVVEMPDTVDVCPDATTVDIPFLWTSGRLEGATLNFDSKATTAGFASQYTFDTTKDILMIEKPKDIRPDLYMATLSYTTPMCMVPDRPIYVQICYPSEIVMQRNNVLMIKNIDYNGGHQFVHFQWYRDGVLIPGATQANLAVTNNDIGHEFYVYVVREGETTPIRTCSIWYGQTALDNVSVSELHWPVKVFSVLGVYLGTIEKDGINSLSSGVYILTDGKNTANIVH